MPATVSAMVFLLAAGLAVSALVLSWADCGRTALALQDRMPAGNDGREMRFTIVESVRHARDTAVLQPDFRRQLPVRTPCHPLRAAA